MVHQLSRADKPRAARRSAALPSVLLLVGNIEWAPRAGININHLANF